MSVPRLSICIPTYNRGEFLPALFATLSAEFETLPDPGQVEVCISDNCSTDASSSLIEAFASRNGNVRCARNERNLGFDENLQIAGSMARGEWIWFMGSDDLLPEGACTKALSTLEACSPRTGVVLWNRKRIAINGSPMADEDWFPFIPDRAEIEPAAGFLPYCETASTIGCLFSYIGVLMLRREAWQALDFGDRRHIGSGYIHVARTLSVVLAGWRIAVRHDGIATCRMNDDLVREAGLYRRLLLDFEGYHRIGRDLIADLTLRQAWWSVLWKEHPLRFDILRRCTRAQAREMSHLWIELGQPPWQIRLLRLAADPLCRPFTKPFMRLGHSLRKLLRQGATRQSLKPPVLA